MSLGNWRDRSAAADMTDKKRGCEIKCDPAGSKNNYLGNPIEDVMLRELKTLQSTNQKTKNMFVDFGKFYIGKY